MLIKGVKLVPTLSRKLDTMTSKKIYLLNNMNKKLSSEFNKII